jgi:hypothetical protein
VCLFFSITLGLVLNRWQICWADTPFHHDIHANTFCC